MEGYNKMAHDRMTNDDLDRNMGRAGQDEGFGGQQGKHTPGRNPDDQQTGQKGAGQKNKPAGGGAEEDEYSGGGSGQQSGRNPGQGGQGGQNR